MTGLDLLPWVSAPEVFPQLETSGKADETSPNLSRPTGGRTSPSLLPPFFFIPFPRKCGGIDKTSGSHAIRPDLTVTMTAM